MQIICLLHQRRCHRGVDLRHREPLVAHLLLNHWHRRTHHQRIHHMAMHEDMSRHLFLRESFCLGETTWIPASSARRSMVLSTSWCSGDRSSGRGSSTSIQLQSLLYGLQRSLIHPDGPDLRHSHDS